MKVFKLEVTLTGVAMVQAETEAQAVEIAQGVLPNKIVCLDPMHELVFAGNLGSSKRPTVSLSPTTMIVGLEDDATLVHRS